MYFTTFYSGTREEFSIIHENEPRQYGEDRATYENYLIVTRRPTADEAKAFFSIAKPQTLCAGISSAKTEKL